MKKILLLIIITLSFTGCMKEDMTDKPSDIDLSGRYISDKAGIREIFLLSLNKDRTGSWENYNLGKLEDKEIFTWSASNKELTFNYSSGKSDNLLFVNKNNELIISEVTYRKVPDAEFSSITGHTYIAADWQYSTHRTTYLLYTFNQDGTISIDERLDTINGELYETSKGKYKTEGTNILLEIQSIPDCDNCFNNFTASIDASYKAFTYEILDISIDTKRTLFFYAIR